VESVPLRCGKDNIGKNIRVLRHEGYPQRQAIAIAMSHSRKCENPYTRNVRGMKKCVINVMAHAVFSDPKTARKSLNRALKTCKSKVM